MAIENFALRHRAALERDHYVLNPDPEYNYWANVSSGRLDQYKTSNANHFCLVIAGNAMREGDFFAIPFAAVAHMFSDNYMSSDKSGRKRWILTIKNFKMSVGCFPQSFDVGIYFGNSGLLAVSEAQTDEAESDENDFAIENRKTEVKIRLKQSKFRRRILENFGSQCCISGISEPDLLIASHIVPWADRVSCRLDPANGLCLFTLYDQLFDAGYFSLTDSLTVVISTKVVGISEPLRLFLTSIDGVKIRRPQMVDIRRDYLAYHRKKFGFELQ